MLPSLVIAALFASSANAASSFTYPTMDTWDGVCATVSSSSLILEIGHEVISDRPSLRYQRIYGIMGFRYRYVVRLGQRHQSKDVCHHKQKHSRS